MNNAEQIIESSGVLITTLKKYLYIMDRHINRLEATVDWTRQLIVEEGQYSVLPNGETVDWGERLYSREEELKAVKELRDKIANS